MACESHFTNWSVHWPPRNRRETPWLRAGSYDISRPAFDIFGYPLDEWHDGVSVAWDGFGFRVYAVSVWYHVEVEREERHGDLPLKSLTRGFVVRIYDSNTFMNIAISVAGRVPHDEAPWGVEVVASVRAVKHWVSRWRRGIRRLRWRNASMVMANKLPSVPEVIHNVRRFL